MLEITKEDIKALDFSDLRSLIAILAESELVSLGLSASGVTWGGSDTTPDGGSDVRVETSINDKKSSYISKSFVIFQSKKPSMLPSKIRKEMYDNGIIKPIFQEIENKKGAYIIASAKADVANLEPRKP